jgi:DNA-binding response OmpR family regulator
MSDKQSHLTGKRILLVEDEYFIADDMRRALLREDVEVLGPVNTIDAALAIAEAERLDAAILDVNLHGAMSFPIADRLSEQGVPDALATGYDDWALPERFSAAQRVAKPFHMPTVVEMLERLTAPGSDSR